MTTIVWFRQDLRLTDNPALSSAVTAGAVLPIYILDDTVSRPMGSASKWWLHQSLNAIQDSLDGLILRRGQPLPILTELAQISGANAVYWNRRYDPDSITKDKHIKRQLESININVRTFNASLLNEPWQIATKSGTPFRVFTSYWKAACARPLAKPLPSIMPFSVFKTDASENLKDWNLAPLNPNWATDWNNYWKPGEVGAQARLHDFLIFQLDGYGKQRDCPSLQATSCLSAHLRFGEISPLQILTSVNNYVTKKPELSDDKSKFLSQIGWREFSYHLLYHFPSLTKENLRPAFDDYPWRVSPKDLKLWQKGKTGYPLVDAGMRELWKTGSMHNRVRMIVASFLVKHLRINWREGEAWFWDTLLDADAANNPVSWQWVSGSGADAAPYFRIFNPVLQARKFDPHGNYIKQWCPELSALDTKWIHAPWEASSTSLSNSGITLGTDYPLPMVAHTEARNAALHAYSTIRN